MAGSARNNAPSGTWSKPPADLECSVTVGLNAVGVRGSRGLQGGSRLLTDTAGAQQKIGAPATIVPRKERVLRAWLLGRHGLDHRLAGAGFSLNDPPGRYGSRYRRDWLCRDWGSGMLALHESRTAVQFCAFFRAATASGERDAASKQQRASTDSRPDGTVTWPIGDGLLSLWGYFGGNRCGGDR